MIPIMFMLQLLLHKLTVISWFLSQQQLIDAEKPHILQIILD